MRAPPPLVGIGLVAFVLLIVGGTFMLLLWLRKSRVVQRPITYQYEIVADGRRVNRKGLWDPHPHLSRTVLRWASTATLVRRASYFVLCTTYYVLRTT